MRVLVLGALAIIASVPMVNANPLTCATLRARLFVSFYKDKELSPRPEIIPGGDLPTYNVLFLDPGGDDYDGYIWCKKSNDAVEELALDVNRINLLRPSVAKRSEALIADAICTLVKANMPDCDGVALALFQSLAKSEYADLTLAPNNWSLSLRASTDSIHIAMNPGLATDETAAAMQLSR